MDVRDLGEKWLAAYTACLKNHKIRAALAIARQYRPAKLYKYFSFQSPYWRENAFLEQIPFNAPSRFNDPLDSRWFLDYDTVYGERFKELGERWVREEMFDDELYQSLIRLDEEDLLYLHDLFCVSCFSTTPHSNPMWGYYGEKHTGFCLEYDVARLPREMQILLPVVYTDTPFDASLLLDMRGIDDPAAALCPSLFKSTDWSHEKEWRIFVPNENGAPPRILSAPGSVTGVYFGFRAYSDARDELERWAEGRQIPTYQIERSYLSFALKSQDIRELRAQKPPAGFML